MTIQKFIEAAIEGKYFISGQLGDPEYVVWQDPVAYGIYWIRWNTFPADPHDPKRVDIHWMFLDPKAWEAVGRTKNWKPLQVAPVPDEYQIDHEWKYNMHMLIQELCAGRTIEQYLETLN